MDDPATTFSFERVFLGDEPLGFLLEIAFRTVVIYSYTLLLVRWIGSRPIAQLSLVALLLVIALGSAVGDAMFYPDVPLVHCMLAITIVILFDKGLSILIARSSRVERLIEGRTVQVVRDGVIHCGALEKLHFGHDELFEQLRQKRVTHLGQVRAAYLETNGLLSVFRVSADEERPGLSIDPPWDVAEPTRLEAGAAVPLRALLACARCASVLEPDARDVLPRCPHCEGRTWHVMT